MLTTKLAPTALLATLLFAVADRAGAETLVREFQGDDDILTPAFRVEGPWLLDWWFHGDYAESLIALEVWLVDADTGRNIGQVVYRKHGDDGLKLFNTTGNYQFRVSGTLARWRLRVVQLTPEEAEAYTPKRRPGPSIN